MAKIQMTKSSVNVTVQEAFSSFIKRAELKNLSPYTLKYLKESYRYLTKVVSQDAPISSLTSNCIDNLIYMLKPTMKDVSINTRLRGIRSFVNYCSNMGYIKPFKVQMLNASQGNIH